MNFKLYKILLVFLFIIATIVFLYMYKSAIYKQIYEQLNNLRLIPIPERFTELYFENHANLPKEIIKNEKIFFSFTIHNLEGVDMEYLYAVYFKNNYGKTIVEQNIAFVKDNEYRTITESYIFKSSSAEEILFVELIDKRQEIHFSLKNK